MVYILTELWLFCKLWRWLCWRQLGVPRPWGHLGRRVGGEAEQGEALPAALRRMRLGIVAHDEHVSEEHESALGELDFVFVAVDDNVTRQWLLPILDRLGVPFVDVAWEWKRPTNGC